MNETRKIAAILVADVVGYSRALPRSVINFRSVIMRSIVR